MSNKYDSTGAMAAAWFGTPGAGAAIDRVFPGDTRSKKTKALKRLFEEYGQAVLDKSYYDAKEFAVRALSILESNSKEE